MSATAALLPDGRLHLQHGPIDCVCRAWGEAREVRAAYAQAARFFASVLDDLCTELVLLRSALPARPPIGSVARAMHLACMPFSDGFITPMAAVAGAVADGVLAAMVEGRALSKAFVNNGGDIAFHLAPGASLRCGLVTDLAGILGMHAEPPSYPSEPRADASQSPSSSSHPEALHADRDIISLERQDEEILKQSLILDTACSGGRQPFQDETQRIISDGTFLLSSDHSGRGLATSGRACKGRGGRSFSFGIADSVSILARTAAQADAAATIIGNAVDLPGHGAIDRRPASEIDPASDLGDRPVTYEIALLTSREIEEALDAGETMVDSLLRDGLIDGAVLALRGHLRVRCSSLALLEPA